MTRNDPEETTLTPKQEALIAALLAGNNITVSAQVTGIGDKTARRWLKLPHFQAAYRAAQKQVFNESLSSLMLYTDEAIGVLRAMMKDESVQPPARIRAAQIILEQSIDTHKTSELEGKIEQLEQMLKDGDRT